MPRRAITLVPWLGVAALLACAQSPAAPSPPPQPPSPFANVVGDFTLTIAIDERCTDIPRGLAVRTYDVVLVDNGWHFMPVRIAGERFGYLGGEIWPPGPDARFRFKWNSFDVGGCGYPEPVDSTSLYLCGEGSGILDDAALSGVIQGSAYFEGSRPGCSDASHRFALVRQTR
jgi:hypothetical protein